MREALTSVRRWAEAGTAAMYGWDRGTRAHIVPGGEGVGGIGRSTQQAARDIFPV